MPEISKPDYTNLWASGGSLVSPSSVKIQTGWTAEVPPFQWENWSQNRQDQAIAHVLQHGVSAWDSVTEYILGKSYVQGSDGFIYKALTTNTNINPVTDVASNWIKLSLTPDQMTQVATASQARAMTSDTVFISPLQLSNAFTGINQLIGATGFQKLPGGLILQWGSVSVATSGTTFSWAMPFPNANLAYATGTPVSSAAVQAQGFTNSGGTLILRNIVTGAAVAGQAYYIILGY